MKIKLTDIANPPVYVRKGIDIKRVQDFVRLAAGLAPDQEIPKKPKLLSWPFPAIKLAKLPIDKEQKKKSKPFELVDGSHRVKVAKIFGLKDIEATASTLDPEQRFIEQIMSAENGPKPLTNQERAQAIWTLFHQFGVTQGKIGKTFGYHRTQISRICSKKSGWADRPGRKTGSQSKGKGKVIISTGLEQIPGKVLTPAEWYDRVNQLLDIYEKEGNELPYTKHLESFGEAKIEKFLDRLGVFFDNVEEVLKEKRG